MLRIGGVVLQAKWNRPAIHQANRYQLASARTRRYSRIGSRAQTRCAEGCNLIHRMQFTLGMTCKSGIIPGCPRKPILSIVSTEHRLVFLPVGKGL